MGHTSDIVIPIVVQNGAGIVPNDLRVEVYPNIIRLSDTTGERVITWQTVVVRQDQQKGCIK